MKDNEILRDVLLILVGVFIGGIFMIINFTYTNKLAERVIPKLAESGKVYTIGDVKYKVNIYDTRDWNKEIKK